jgi:hypothetical protein
MKTETMDNKLAKLGIMLCMAVGLCILAKAAFAGNVAGASALQKNSTNANTSGLGIQLVTGADFNGNTANGLSVNFPPQALTVTGNIGGSVTITALPVYNPSGITQYTALSSTATDINLTNTAGAAVPCIVCLSSNGGAAAGFKFFFGANGASTTNLIAGQGHYIAASSTAQCWGPFVSGTHFYGVGVAASSSVLVDVQKVQAQ